MRQRLIPGLYLFLLTFGPSLTLAQPPSIGIIDVYGSRKIAAADIRKFLGITEGARLPGSKGDLEDRLEHMPGVVSAHVEAACCDDSKVILYVGVEEKGAPHFDYHAPPAGDVELPEEVVATYRRFLIAVREAGRTGQVSEDLSQGHSLLADPDARAVQMSFVPLANQHLALLRQVIHESSKEEQRAMAAYIIGYADKKADVVADLQYAVQDSDDTVRNNAIRSLAALAVLAQKDKDAGLRISATWLVEMLNSVVWSDRNNAAIALVNLTDSRDPAVLQQIKDRALPALTEMARWTYLPHALPAYIVLGRVKDIPEKRLQDLWSNGQRDVVIKSPASSKKK